MLSFCLWGHSAITQPNLAFFICEVTIPTKPNLNPRDLLAHRGVCPGAFRGKHQHGVIEGLARPWPCGLISAQLCLNKHNSVTTE